MSQLISNSRNIEHLTCSDIIFLLEEMLVDISDEVRSLIALLSLSNMILSISAIVEALNCKVALEIRCNIGLRVDEFLSILNVLIM